MDKILYEVKISGGIFIKPFVLAIRAVCSVFSGWHGGECDIWYNE